MKSLAKKTLMFAGFFSLFIVAGCLNNAEKSDYVEEVNDILEEPNFVVEELDYNVSSNWREHKENGEVVGYYDESGKKVGKWKEWDEYGRILWEGNYKDGKKEGLWIGSGWTEGGFEKWEGSFKNGKQEGLWKARNENGQLIEERNYKAGELGDGLSRKWYENGQLLEETEYIDGKLEIRKWDENGQLLEEY